MLRKRVCIVASFAPSILNFRKELVLQLLITHDVYVCVPAVSAVVRVEIESLGVQCIEIAMSSGGLNPFHDLSYCYALYRVFKKITPDLVLSYTIKPVIWSAFAAKVAGVKQVASIITGLGYAFTDLHSLKRRLVNKLVCTLYRAALYFNNMVFFQNTDDYLLFKTQGLLGKTSSQVINGSGVNLSHFEHEPQFPQKLTFFMMGRLLRDKGIYEFIAAAKHIKKNHDVDFYVAGWFDHNPACITQDELDSWCESGVIKFLGQLEDVRESLRASSVFVLPSYREGTPRSVLEAMAIGRPIITTDAPGCRETVIHGENGYLVPIKNVEELVFCMKQFIEDASLLELFGEKSRKRVVEYYDVHQVNREILSALELAN